MISTAPTTKHCPSCQSTKSVDDFYKKKAGESGTQYECKRCQLDRRRVPGAPTRVRATKTPKLQKPAPCDTPDALERKPKNPRYSIVRNVSRRTGEASWGILDGRRYDGTNPVVFIGQTLKDALEELDRLNTPPERLKYVKHGQVGFIDPDKELEESFRID